VGRVSAEQHCSQAAATQAYEGDKLRVVLPFNLNLEPFALAQNFHFDGLAELRRRGRRRVRAATGREKRLLRRRALVPAYRVARNEVLKADALVSAESNGAVVGNLVWRMAQRQ
jgi:hypothetical protein